MNHLFNGLAAGLLLLTLSTSGCVPTGAHMATLESDSELLPSTVESTTFTKSLSSARLLDVSAHQMTMQHNGDTYHGVEYQMQIVLPVDITQRHNLNRIQAEVEFSGQTKELMGTERVKRPLQLQRIVPDGNQYLVRVASIYRPEYREQVLAYLLEHTDELHTSLYLDDAKILSLHL